MLSETNRRLVLRFDPGQFTFRSFDHFTDDTTLHELAHRLNDFRDTEVKRVLKVQSFELVQ